MRRIALLLAACAWGCGDPDGSADEPGYIYSVFGDDSADLLVPDVAVDRAGTVYFPDWNKFQILALEGSGTRVIAGSGEIGGLADGPARDVNLNHVGDLAFDDSGNLFVSAWHDGRIARIDLATGMLSLVAGTGTRARYTGDGGPALDADVSLPAGLALLPDGRLLFADQDNQVLRAVDLTTGLVEHVAGRCVVEVPAPCATPIACPGSERFACDTSYCSGVCSPAAGPDIATRADVRFGFDVGAAVAPGGKLAVTDDGTVLVTEAQNGRVRAMHPDGRIDTLVDGIRHPEDIAVDTDGSVYIADDYDSCIWRVAPDGAVSTVAGVCGSRGYNGDAMRASEALLDRPNGIGIDRAAARLYIADTSNRRIRYMTLPR